MHQPKLVKFISLAIAFTCILLFQNCNTTAVHDKGENSASSIIDNLTSEGLIEIDYELESKALEIIHNRCLACHNNTRAAFNINLEGDSLVLARKVYILPGFAEQSYLFKSIVAHKTERASVSPMPEDAPLSDQDILTIEEWINNGIVFKEATDETEEETPVYTYNDHIIPVLERNKCLECHSSESSSHISAGSYLVFDNYEDLMKVVQIGNPYSLLLDAIESGRMPKEGQMQDGDFEILQSWVLTGARE